MPVVTWRDCSQILNVSPRAFLAYLKEGCAVRVVQTRRTAHLTVEDAGRYECRLLGSGQRRAQLLPVSELLPKTRPT